MERAVFLDRDGTLIVEREFLSDPDGVSLLPGAVDALRRLNQAGLRIVLVTNQSGIARGLYDQEAYDRVTHRLKELLQEQGIRIEAIYHCPHHPEFTGPCECRKPGTGLHHQAARELGIELAGSFYVGDRFADVEPARILGGVGILVRTGYGRREESRVGPETQVVEDVLEAVDRVILPK